MANKLVNSDGKYYLYQTKDGNELWLGKINLKNSFRVGYLADIENFSIGVYEAEEEAKQLFKELQKEFGGLK